MDRELLLERLERLAIVLDELMPQCAELVRNAISMLKEQEAIPVDTKVIGTFNGDMEVYCCRDCRTILDPAFHYCPYCGQAMKWEL